jgi:hypothetical protein
MRKTLAATAALVALLLLALPTGASAFSKAIWGPATRGGVDQFPIYRELGVGIYQTDLNWHDAAPTRPHNATDPNDPAYRWSPALDQAVTRAAQFHMRVLVMIIGAPPWANGNRSWVFAPKRPSDFAAFATAAARRYSSAHLWMIWGEPTSGKFLPLAPAPIGAKLNRAQQVAPHSYARLLDAAYGALKRVSPQNQVIGGNTYTAGAVDTLQWVQNMRLPNGRPPRMDLYGHNPFGYREPIFSASPSPVGEVQFADLPRLAGWIDHYLHRGLPIFLSEYTIPTAVDQEFGFWVDAPVAARWITEALRVSREWHRIYGLGWIHVYDDPPDSYGGLISSNGVRKPLFQAFARG